jgi:hypothetical protein
LNAIGTKNWDSRPLLIHVKFGAAGQRRGGNTMSNIRTLFARFARIFVVGALTLAAAQAPTRQSSASAAAASVISGDRIILTTPQFLVQAISFKSDDETGWDWLGSDEVYAVWSDMDPTHYDRTTTVFDDVDSGESRTFATPDNCMAPQAKCDRGMGELNVRFSFWERDAGWFEFCNGDVPGLHYVLEHGMCTDDDLIGTGSVILSAQDLVAALPNVGDSHDYTAVMSNSGKYELRYRITRLANSVRPLVNHLPGDIEPLGITLQATAVANQQVHLTWSGASTTTIDIYRDGTKVATTANDGDYTTPPIPPGSHQYRVCDLNSTSACSPDVTVVVT